MLSIVGASLSEAYVGVFTLAEYKTGTTAFNILYSALEVVYTRTQPSHNPNIIML